MPALLLTPTLCLQLTFAMLLREQLGAARTAPLRGLAYACDVDRARYLPLGADRRRRADCRAAPDMLLRTAKLPTMRMWFTLISVSLLLQVLLLLLLLPCWWVRASQLLALLARRLPLLLLLVLLLVLVLVLRRRRRPAPPRLDGGLGLPAARRAGLHRRAAMPPRSRTFPASAAAAHAGATQAARASCQRNKLHYIAANEPQKRMEI